MSNFITFLETYKKHLHANRITQPWLYTWELEQLDAIAEKMVLALAHKMTLVDNKSIQRTCRELDIKCNLTAIAEYLNVKPAFINIESTFGKKN